MCILRVYKMCEQKLSFIILVGWVLCPSLFLKKMYNQYFTITVMITTFFNILHSEQIY